MAAFLRKYATATHIYVPVIKRGVVDYALGADWTPASGDVKVSIDGGAAANIGTLPTAVAMGNGAYWDFTIATGEVTGKKVIVTVSDSATKAVEDQAFVIETYGHASAEYQADLSLPNLPANVTQFGGSAGTFASGRPDVNTTHAAGTAWGSGAITSGSIATNAIGAAQLAADAVTEIQSGLATSAEVTGLNVNTRANVVVPIEIETPDASTQVYKIRLFLFDVTGNMEAPDSTPTIALVNAAGTDRSSRLSVASNPSAGVYSWDYTATAGDAEEQLVWTFTVVEAGLTRTYPATSYVVEETAYRFSSSDRATLNAAATAANLALVKTDTAAIKLKTDNLPASPAATGDIPTAAQNAAATRDVNNTSPAANSLGAAVNSASAPTAAAVADAVWDEILSGHQTAGSAGEALSSAGSGGISQSVITNIANQVATILGDNPIYVQSPATSDGTLDLVQGMDYYTADGREIEFTFIRNYVPSSCKLTVAAGEIVTVTSTDISESSGSGSGRFHVRFQLPRADGDALEAGSGSFEVYSIVSGREVPEIAEGVATIRRRLTP